MSGSAFYRYLLFDDEDCTFCVFASIDALLRDVEPPEVETGQYWVIDESGRLYNVFVVRERFRKNVKSEPSSVVVDLQRALSEYVAKSLSWESICDSLSIAQLIDVVDLIYSAIEAKKFDIVTGRAPGRVFKYADLRKYIR